MTSTVLNETDVRPKTTGNPPADAQQRYRALVIAAARGEPHDEGEAAEIVKLAGHSLCAFNDHVALVKTRLAAGAQLAAARETEREMESLSTEFRRVEKEIEDHFQAHGAKPPVLLRRYDELCSQYRTLSSEHGRETNKSRQTLRETADPAVLSQIARAGNEICALDGEIMGELPKEKDRVEALKDRAKVAREQFTRFRRGLPIGAGFDAAGYAAWPEWLGESGAYGAIPSPERANLAACEERIARYERQAEIAERQYLERAERAPREREESRSRLKALEAQVYDPLHVRLD